MKGRITSHLESNMIYSIPIHNIRDGKVLIEASSPKEAREKAHNLTDNEMNPILELNGHYVIDYDGITEAT